MNSNRIDLLFSDMKSLIQHSLKHACFFSTRSNYYNAHLIIQSINTCLLQNHAVNICVDSNLLLSQILWLQETKNIHKHSCLRLLFFLSLNNYMFGGTTIAYQQYQMLENYYTIHNMDIVKILCNIFNTSMLLCTCIITLYRKPHKNITFFIRTLMKYYYTMYYILLVS